MILGCSQTAERRKFKKLYNSYYEQELGESKKEKLPFNENKPRV